MTLFAHLPMFNSMFVLETFGVCVCKRRRSSPASAQSACIHSVNEFSNFVQRNRIHCDWVIHRLLCVLARVLQLAMKSFYIWKWLNANECIIPFVSPLTPRATQTPCVELLWLWRRIIIIIKMFCKMPKLKTNCGDVGDHRPIDWHSRAHKLRLSCLA